MFVSLNRLLSNIKDIYQGINGTILTGAIDVIVVKQADGSYKSTPFHVCFGTIGILRPSEQIVDITVNKKFVTHLEMRLAPTGEAYFETGLGGEVIVSEDHDEHERKQQEPATPSNSLCVACHEERPDEDVFQMDSDSEEKVKMNHNYTKKIATNGTVPASMDDSPTQKDDHWKSAFSAEHWCNDSLPQVGTESSSHEPSHPQGTSSNLINGANHFNWTDKNMDDSISHNPLPKEILSSSNGRITPPLKNSQTSRTKSTSQLSVGKTEELQQGKFLSEVVDSMETDPSITNLYLYNHHTSTPESVNEASHSCYPHDNDTQVKHIRPLPVQGNDSSQEFLLSLCGGLDGKNEPTFEHFIQHIVSEERFAEDPVALFSNPDLVIRWNGMYYTWSGMSATLVSLLAFQVPLSPPMLTKLNVSSKLNSSIENVKTNISTGRSSGFRGWLFGSRAAVKNDQQKSTIPGDIDRERHVSVTISPSTNTNGSQTPGQYLSSSLPRETFHLDESGYHTESSSGAFHLSNEWHSDVELYTNATAKESPTIPVYKTSESARASPIPHIQDSPTHSAILSQKTPQERMKSRTNRLTSDLIEKLNLVEGANEVVFSVTSRFQGTCSCSCYIYLWNWNDRIIVSDIDGTITKSDVLGNIFSLVGPYWAQSGIAELYHRISTNDYKIIYLSARAIGQSAVTRNYLRALRQDGFALPDGPVLLSPTSLFKAFHKEVIERRPEEFKIACLMNVKSVFPCDEIPLYAGFGNRPNDVVTYKAVGIDLARIFTVNHLGQLRHELPGNPRMILSYTTLRTIIDMYFPPVQHLRGACCAYSDFIYWRYPSVQDVSDLIASLKQKR